MKFLICKLPQNIRIIITNLYIILLSNLGFLFFKIKFLNCLYCKKSLYLLMQQSVSSYGIKSLFYHNILNCIFGFFFHILLFGVGFRVWLENSKLYMRLGYSNILLINIPFSIHIKSLNKTEICLYSFDLNCLMLFCMSLRCLKVNNVYKKRGLYFKNEIIQLRKLKMKKDIV